MTLKTDIYLLGGLGIHRRGAVIADYLSVNKLKSDADLPDHGLLMLFGQEWQTFSQQQQVSLMEWLGSSGRVILLIPPFNTGLLADAMDWQVESVSIEKTASMNGVAQRLADETRFQFSGLSYQFSREYAHNWNDDSLNTLYYKSHSSGGVLAATSLPLWSLTCLDVPELVESWLGGLIELAGQVKVAQAQVEKEHFTPNDKHLALLCCAYGKMFDGEGALVQRVLKLGLFRFSPEELDTALLDLIEESLFTEGELTDKGLAIVDASPYKVYADELKRMP